MRPKRPHVASLDEVTITREGDGAVIAYKQPGFRITHFMLGREMDHMTDQEILDRFNDGIRATEALVMSRPSMLFAHLRVTARSSEAFVRDGSRHTRTRATGADARSRVPRRRSTQDGARRLPSQKNAHSVRRR
jgi:hypothetical protein